MDTKGLKYFVYAKYANNAYSGGAVLAEAMSAEPSYNFDNAELYSNDALSASDRSFIDGTLTLGVKGLTSAKRADLLGHTAHSPNDGFTANKSDVAPFVGIGFYGKTIDNTYAAVFYPKVQFVDPNDSMSTRPKATTYKTPVLLGTIMLDDDGDWIMQETFALEADAIAYLNGLTGISVSASGGLTALALTGTGGTLSPAYGAAVRYYTFGGVSAASVTVTPTAAAHTIKLYVNEVYVQDIVSGQPSNAIAMSIGTKKLRLVAYESGKSSQTTEIIVVKTA